MSDEDATRDSAGAAGEDVDEPAPLADLAAAVGERDPDDAGDPFEAAFAEPGFDAVDSDDLWEADDALDERLDAVDEETVGGTTTHVIPKRSFCEGCRHFDDPPTVRCTHEGTEILEFVDMDHVRVRGCPIVEDRGLLEDALGE